MHLGMCETIESRPKTSNLNSGKYRNSKRTVMARVDWKKINQTMKFHSEQEQGKTRTVKQHDQFPNKDKSLLKPVSQLIIYFTREVYLIQRTRNQRQVEDYPDCKEKHSRARNQHQKHDYQSSSKCVSGAEPQTDMLYASIDRI